MKILQLSSAQALGGGERHLADLANALADRSHEIHAALRPKSALIDELHGVPPQNLLTLPLRNALDALSARRLARYVGEHKIQIVHAHLARDYPLAAYATQRNPGSQLVLTRHVLFPLNRLHSLTLSRVARVIAVSEAVRRQLRGQSLLPDERIVVIPNGIDLGRFERSRTEADFRRRWNIPTDHVLIGTVGEVTPLKGHADFLRSAALVLRRFPTVQFLIAGVDPTAGGKNLAALKSLIAELDLAGSVRVMGWVDDLASLYFALDVFVSASHTESFGLVIAEAMASGTPVVATETEGAKEIIANEENGLLVPIGDVEAMAKAIMELLDNEKRKQSLTASGRVTVKERFSLGRMVAETEAIYQQVLEQANSHR